MNGLLIDRFRLTRAPSSPGGQDGWAWRATVFPTPFDDAQPVDLDIEVSDSTRVSLPVNDSAMRLLVEQAVRRLVPSRIERFAERAIEQVRSWPQPIVLSRDHFPDTL
jgi:hypothetical protein